MADFLQQAAAHVAKLAAPNIGGAEPTKKHARDNHMTWFCTIIPASAEALDLVLRAPFVTPLCMYFFSRECSRAFITLKRGQEQHRRHLHAVFEFTDARSYDWVRWRLGQCVDAAAARLQLKAVCGAKLGTFDGMLGYIIKGTTRFRLSEACLLVHVPRIYTIILRRLAS